MLVTTNYFISNGYVERREMPLKPSSTVSGMKANFSNSEGISEAHRLWLATTLGNSS